MDDNNRVTVKIYGQEYTIAGDKSREHIIKVADYVDMKMHEIAKVVSGVSMSSLAVLSAVNVADDYFTAIEKLSSLKSQNEQLEKDSKHYVQLWDEAKKSFLQYKEDAQVSIEQKEELQRMFNEKIVELDRTNTSLKHLEAKYAALLQENEELSNKLKAQQEDRISDSSALEELEAKCKDMENSFFDLQMENIRLKSDLDKYRKLVEDKRLTD
ncbi:MAG TPA: cell division protein ZapA [Clostridiales bacterium]|jgi:cell division protein ZapA|nr:cell division protein ZapA [Clostridiales bacterium]